MRVWVRRGLVMPAAVAAAVGIVAILAMHVPWTRTAVLRWATGYLSRYDLALQAAELRYNLLTRRVTLDGVRLAATGHEGRPFFVADRIEVRLPVGVFGGRVELDQIDIAGGRVDIYRDERGVANIPPGSGGPPLAVPRRLAVHGFTAAGLAVTYADALRDWSLSLPGIDVDLRRAPVGADGPFAVRGATAVRIGARTLTLAPIDTTMSFDGSTVTLGHARLAAPEFTAVLSGPIHRVLDTATLAMRLDGIVDVGRAQRWVPPPPVPVGGTAAIEGTVTGPLDAIVLRLNTSSRDLAIGRDAGVAMAGPVTVTTDATTGEGVVFTPASGGEIRADFTIPWGAAPPSTARAVWRDLDAQAALRLGDFDPQAIGAAFSGSGFFEFGAVVRYTATNRAIGRRARGLVPVTGTLNASLVGDAYVLRHAHRVAGMLVQGDTAGRFDRDDPPRTTLAGPLRAEIDDVATAAASAEALGIEMPEIAREVRGGVEASMTVAGSFRDPFVDGVVSGGAVFVPLVGVVRASAKVASDSREATIAAIDVRKGTAVLEGDARADIIAGTWSGALRLRAPDGVDVQDDVPEAWRIHGPIAATATLGGTFDAVRLDTRIEGGAFTWAGQPFDGVTASLVATPTDVDVTSLRATQGEGAVDARGTYTFESGAYTASVRAHSLTWHGDLLPGDTTRAAYAIAFDGAGTLDRPFGKGALDFVLAGGTAGGLIDTGHAEVELFGGFAQVTGRLPALGVSATAEVATAAPYPYRAAATLDRLDAARLASAAGAVDGEVLGFVSGDATAAGTLDDGTAAAAIVNLHTVDVALGGVPIALNAPARITARGAAWTVGDVDLRVGSGRLTASGEWTTPAGGTVTGAFDGDLSDAIRMGRAAGVPVALDGSGRLSIRIGSTGVRAGTTATLSVAGGSLSWRGGPAVVRDMTVDAALGSDSLTIARLSGRVASGGVVGDFSARAAARLPAFELAALDGDLTVDDARFTFSGIPVAQQRPSRVRFADGTVTASDVEWLVANNSIRVSGSAGIAADDPPLDLAVQGLVDLRILSAVAATVAFDGTADLDARVGGVWSKPALGGQIVLNNVDIAVDEPRLVLSEVAGPISLMGQTVLLEDLRGFANGGTLAVDGVLRLEDFAVAGGVLNVQAQAVTLELVKGFRSEVDALVIFRADPAGPSLTGDVRIAQSSYTDTITIAALARRAALPAAPMVQRPFLDRLRLNLAITTTDDTVINNNYGRLEAGVDLRIVGTVAEPGADGRVTLREGGQVFLAGRTFRITRGDISFSDRSQVRPEFNIAAEARIDGEDVTMTLSGTLERPQLDLTSEAGSRTPGELASTIVGTNNTETALTLLSADLLGVTGRAIGLDAFRVERGDYVDPDFQVDPGLIGNNLDPTTRLTVAKRISDQVEITVSQNLRESGKTTVIVSYLPGANVEVRALSLDNATVSLGIRHEVTLGASPRGPAATRRAPAVVRAVRFEGVDADVEARARRIVRLEAGDTFDFIALQRDVDRLRQALLAEGYFEARVRPRRIDDAAAHAVEVEYRIDRGPLGSLEVTGVDLPPSEIDALEAAWGANTFDQFLIDDLTNRVRRYLVTHGELASVVVGTIDRPAAGRKHVRIDVTPGVPVTGREIRFTGNERVRSGVLDAALSAAGLDVEGWIDRTVVERELRALYSEAGYLQARVDAGPLDLDGTVGVLPVTIVEGPQAMITAITWDGVAEARLPAAVAAAGVSTPSPYVSGDVQEARRRVERQYRGDGYNAVQVRVSPSFEPGDAVVLAFQVTEGPRQVLRDVATSGAAITRGDVIREALRFELGQPVDQDEWARARKRLYDTNVFRQVDIQATPIGEVTDGVQAVRADVTVVESPAWSLRYGAQLEGDREAAIEEFTSTRNVGVVAEVKNPNVFGRALTLGLWGQYQRQGQDATVYLSTSRLFGWRARSSLYGYVSRDRVGDGDVTSLEAVTHRAGVSADQRWRTGGFQIVYGYRFERNRTFDADPAVSDPFPLDFVANLARLSAAVLLDRRDDPVNARRGTFTSVSWDHSALWLGSDVSNRKLLLQQYGFLPIGRRVVLAARVQSGFVFGADDLLPGDRFFAGGATTVRGYREDSLGPRDALGLPSGGASLAVLNQEARITLYRWIHGVAFVDAGNITARGGSAWRDLRVGYGAGLRLDSPVGLLRIDYGIPRAGAGFTSGRWYFGLGQIF